MIRIFHNPRCSTSRKVLSALESSGSGFETVLYLKDPPTKDRLADLISRLENPPADLVRKDKRFKDLGLEAGDYVTADAVVALLVDHPELMQRPVLDDGTRAIIGRPPERVASFTNS